MPALLLAYDMGPPHPIRTIPKRVRRRMAAISGRSRNRLRCLPTFGHSEKVPTHCLANSCGLYMVGLIGEER